MYQNNPHSANDKYSALDNILVSGSAAAKPAIGGGMGSGMGGATPATGGF